MVTYMNTHPTDASFLPSATTPTIVEKWHFSQEDRRLVLFAGEKHLLTYATRTTYPSDSLLPADVSLYAFRLNTAGLPKGSPRLVWDVEAV